MLTYDLDLAGIKRDRQTHPLGLELGNPMLLLDPQVLDRFTPLTRKPLAASDTLHPIFRHLDLLDDPNRLLLELTLQRGLSLRQVGIVFNLSAGAVCRRLRRLRQRLCDPLVWALADRKCPLPADHREIGLGHFLNGLSVPQLARQKHRSQEQIRSTLSYIRGWHRGCSSR